MRVSSANRPRHRRKHQATPTDHAIFNEFLGRDPAAGEYSTLHAAFERGRLEPERAMIESLLSIRRAGAAFLVTYFAKDAARVL